MTLQGKQVEARFSLGQLVSTPGALVALGLENITPWSLVARHVRGDWGDMADEDKAANEQALVDGSRVFSAYILPSTVKVWVITEAADEAGHRAATTILLPSEY